MIFELGPGYGPLPDTTRPHPHTTNMTLTPKPELPKSSLVTKPTSKPSASKPSASAKPSGMVVYISWEGKVDAYYSDHELLRNYNKHYKNAAFLSNDTVAAMLTLLDELDSEHDSKYRSMVHESYSPKTEYKAAVLGDFMECVGRKAKDGDDVSACVLVEVPC